MLEAEFWKRPCSVVDRASSLGPCHLRLSGSTESPSILDQGQT